MAKMKLKTHSGAKKRFKLTAIPARSSATLPSAVHILTKKTTKLTRGLRKPKLR